MSNILSFVVGIISSIVAALLLTFVRHLVSVQFTFRRVLRDIERLYHRIRDDNYSPDHIVAIDRNGTIVGAILAGFLGLETVISIATVNHRLTDGSRSITVASTHMPRPESLRDAKLLIVICFNDSGTSLETVYRYFTAPGFATLDVRLAALYTSVSPKLKPRYFGREVGRDLKTSINRIIYKMPWMTKDWRHVFAAERLDSRS